MSVFVIDINMYLFFISVPEDNQVNLIIDNFEK